MTISTQQQEGNQLQSPLINGSLFPLSTFMNLWPFYGAKLPTSPAVLYFTKAGGSNEKCATNLLRESSHFKIFIGLDEKIDPIYTYKSCPLLVPDNWLQINI